MRYFIDTEFHEHDGLIELISIGIVASDGREYYAQSAEYLRTGNPSPWLNEHVIPHLSSVWKEKYAIRDDITAFINNKHKYDPIAFWGWCCAYDYVALCQLFGGMMNTPSHWPHYMHDLQETFDHEDLSDDMLPKQEGREHHALDDARYIKKLYEWGI